MSLRLSLLRQEVARQDLPPSRLLAMVRRWLRHQGAAVIGKGVYATVHESPGCSGQVIKVFGTSRPAGQATLAYLRIAQKDRCPIFPRVHRIVRVRGMVLVWMERLQEANHSLLVNRVSKAMGAYFEKEHYHTRAFGEKDVARMRANPWHSNQVTLRQVAHACQVLEYLMESVEGCGVDLHGGNFMLRPCLNEKKQLVLTDPMS